MRYTNIYMDEKSFEASSWVRYYFLARDFLAFGLGFSVTVLPPSPFAGVSDREIFAMLFSTFVSTKRNLEARPRVTIPPRRFDSGISPMGNSRHSSTASNLRFFDEGFSTTVSVEVTDAERTWTPSAGSTNVSAEDCEVDRFREWDDDVEDIVQGTGAVDDNKRDGVEVGEGNEGGDLVDGVVFSRFRELALVAGGLSSWIWAPMEVASDAADDEGFDSILARLARSSVRGSCVSMTFLAPRRVRFNWGSLSSGRLK